MLTTCAVVALVASLATAASDVSVASSDRDASNTLDANTTYGVNGTLDAERYFIDKIFDKYGDRGVITFEGFEHLLDSLGLGGQVFNSPHDLALHRINGTFKQIHDTQHRHKRSPSREPILRKSCLSPKEILEVYGMENEPGVITIEPKTFLEMCPALVYQLDQRSCYKTEAPAPKLERHWTWIYASLSILVISATGLVGVAIVPMLKSVIFNHVLHFLVAVAVGTLCGDALLHLLPHALKSHGPSSEPQEETEVVLKCSVTFLTILLFYTVEAIMQTIHGGHSHSHDHSQGKSVEEIKTDSSKQIEPIELGAMMPGSPPPPVERPMTSTALMVIVGDGLHNLTDGLAIGAAFSGDPVTGFATALAVFCHELPHELGDFAVLLRSGMSIKRALYYNLLSSVLSFMGMAGGIWLAEDHESTSQWIYAATAGTFFYIALADLVPEINENNHGKTMNLILAVLGILAGGIIMLLIALHEDSIQYLFRSAEQ
ncbi:zinc transporter ZIP10 [Ostrinia nubilalis]|uniref:zinc transporter ZIP10 n=1 Tax=Ostrinia nubilalis TaxID=29057 RepID=UPI003082252A